MNSGRVIPVVLCGGSGTRLWPRSRASKPKPFLPLVGSRTLFEEALLRCRDGTVFDAPIIVTGAAFLDHVRQQIGIAPGAQIIVEPEAKNTAAAIAIAASRLPSDAVMLVCPSDHHIGNEPAFLSAVRAASALAREGWLVSLGIEPQRPETGFGYIRKGAAISESGFKVDQFVEKPDLQRAETFLTSGNYLWNGGIFAFAAGKFLAELARHRPAIAEAVQEGADRGAVDGTCFYPDPSAYSRIPAESVDFAVMENTTEAAVVPADLAWSDIGNWPAVREARQCDELGNSVRGQAELRHCRNVLVDSDGPRIHVLGLQDIVVIVDGEDVLVSSSKDAQQVSDFAGLKRQ